MKKILSIISATLAATLIVAGISAIASGKVNFRKEGFRQNYIMTEKQKTARLEKAKEMLSKQLEAGKITQEQYDEQLAKIESGEFGFGGRGRGKGERPQRKELTEEEKAQMKAKMQEKAKERLSKLLEEGKITQEQYDGQLAKIESGEFGFGGRGRGEKPQRKELTEEEKTEMKAKMQEKAKERLSKLLEEGKITQEQYDGQLAKIESGEFGFGGRGRGDRHFGGKHFGGRGGKGRRGGFQKPEITPKEATEN